MERFSTITGRPITHDDSRRESYEQGYANAIADVAAYLVMRCELALAQNIESGVAKGLARGDT